MEKPRLRVAQQKNKFARFRMAKRSALYSIAQLNQIKKRFKQMQCTFAALYTILFFLLVCSHLFDYDMYATGLYVVFGLCLVVNGISHVVLKKRWNLWCEIVDNHISTLESIIGRKVDASSLER